ncbi:hypothetical protein ABIF65_005693 [Bradyrhizobium japonicum]|nr:hypothetical protein [Bradyrhizobium japonicum]MCP1782314.1 hypothetical protein [Bradyrhizobium japonicum]MCP1861741.1 hypothetical protein [Bradyrhizobium japonicum]MCP1892499.1 hypothetical protein [Bradyrhizobium japonicum]MCP1965397.1 hypothetical protein [Bradyrhizobium japonicum]
MADGRDDLLGIDNILDELQRVGLDAHKIRIDLPARQYDRVVVNLTRALALDLGRKGIRVNAVCPSLTRTGMTEDMMDDKKLLAKFSERIPLGRVCESEEVAAVIAFLASVAVDGGRIRLQWTTAARIAAQRRSSTYFASAVSSKRA